MKEKLNELKKLLGEISDINGAIAVLGWDQQTYMPPGGAESRANQLATLSHISHTKSTSGRIGELLDSLKDYASSIDPDSDDACIIKVVDRIYKKQTKVPAELVSRMTQTAAMAHHIWEKAREESDFSAFQPHLEKIVDLRKEYAELFKPYDHIYDPLLDDFEPGLKTSDVKKIFEELRPLQVELLKKIADSPQVEDSFMSLCYDESKQLEFGVKVATKFGYDWSKGRQDLAAHPFQTTFGPGDARITTRVFPDMLGSAIFSTMHESGHAMYEQGVSLSLARTPLFAGASLAVHESQSRLWENLVGRSYDFWTYFYPELQRTFPAQLGNVSLDDFYKGINKVTPSPIRVEADEATYNMHVMLRLELEIGMMDGSIEVKDLPEIWNSRMLEYLGITPKNDAEGVLQDVHWSSNLIGYFATYALGNLVSAQVWECVNRDIPDLSGQIRNGDFSALLGWLRKNLHVHGSKFEPQDIVKRVTGSKIDPAPYLRYLNEKYSKIYNF